MERGCFKLNLMRHASDQAYSRIDHSENDAKNVAARKERAIPMAAFLIGILNNELKQP